MQIRGGFPASLREENLDNRRIFGVKEEARITLFQNGDKIRVYREDGAEIFSGTVQLPSGTGESWVPEGWKANEWESAFIAENVLVDLDR